VDIKVFKTRAIFRARRRSRSVRNKASALMTSYPRILYAFFLLVHFEIINTGMNITKKWK
jgi:hypothetical protein